MEEENKNINLKNIKINYILGFNEEHNQSKSLNFLFEKNIIDKTEKVKNIPLCNDCLYELSLGNFACFACMVNLCKDHALNHVNNPNFKNHKFIHLQNLND